MTIHLFNRVFLLSAIFAFFNACVASSEETNYLLMLPDESKVKQYAQEHDIFDKHHVGFAEAFFDMNAHARVINNWLFLIDAYKDRYFIDEVVNRRLWVDSDELGHSVEVHKAVGRALWCPSLRSSICIEKEMQILLSLAKQLLEN